MNAPTHVYYDKKNDQIVFFKANLDSTYEFEYPTGEVKKYLFREIETLEERVYYVYLGSLENE